MCKACSKHAFVFFLPLCFTCFAHFISFSCVHAFMRSSLLLITNSLSISINQEQKNTNQNLFNHSNSSKSSCRSSFQSLSDDRDSLRRYWRTTPSFDTPIMWRLSTKSTTEATVRFGSTVFLLIFTTDFRTPSSFFFCVAVSSSLFCAAPEPLLMAQMWMVPFVLFPTTLMKSVEPSSGS